ncbi:MAG: ribose-5-phosphate isomerase RpiA [Lautropia sp.]|nr:ribose-5-phosphate isomerase RpiA [Lautropia sp.]
MNEADSKARQDALKKAAAERAMDWLTPGRIVGVGTGSTVAFFIEALGRRRNEFPQAVSSSEQSTARLRALGIEVLDLNQVDGIDVYVDGADEVDPHFALIKGGGAALTREKIVAQASRQFVCIVDQSKCVPVLGRFPLPVEVVPMAARLVERQLAALGGQARQRPGCVTDNGNVILDVSGLQIIDPQGMEETINQWPGVVTVGLFARRRPETVLVAAPEGVQVLEAPAAD